MSDMMSSRIIISIFRLHIIFSIHRLTFTTLHVCCVKTWVDLHIGLQKNSNGLNEKANSLSDSRWHLQYGTAEIE